MRIVGGVYKGKKLQAPDGDTTRPTSDRARESLFNILSSLLLKEDKKWSEIVFVDVFAGTGAIGLEAASRGAKKVFFIERDQKALKCLANNSKEFKEITILGIDATKVPFSKTPAQIIFMDAPYHTQLWELALDGLLKKGWIDKEAFVIIEVEKNETATLPTSFLLKEERIYGRNKLLFCQKTNEKDL